MAKHKGKKAPALHKKHRGMEVEVEVEMHKKKKKPEHKKPAVKSKSGKAKIEKVMHEFKHDTLHSGSKKGPKVKNPKQAIAIAMNEARKYG